MKTLTSGEIAGFCDVNLRTVIRWIDKGHLKSFKLPGRGNNRVLVNDFLSFLNDYQIPIPPELAQYSKRVLIVDDDKAMANSIKRLLLHDGYSVNIVNDSFLAGEAIHSFMPSVMTLDLKMPGIDGFKILENIADKELRLKTLVISALSDKELQKALTLGAHDVLAKPFDAPVLLQKIDNLMPPVSE
jgi:two-component system response regulator VicR